MLLPPALTLLPLVLAPAPPQGAPGPEDVTARVVELTADAEAAGRFTAIVEDGALVPLGDGGGALEVTRSTTTTLGLEALSGLERRDSGRFFATQTDAGTAPRLMSAPMRGKGKVKPGRAGTEGSGSLEAWTLPGADHLAFREARPLTLRDPGAATAARMRMAVGYAATAGGDVARIEARALPAGTWELIVEWGVGPRGIVLPTPAARAVVEREGEDVHLRLDPAPVLPAELAEEIEWVVEVEPRFGAGSWREVAVLPKPMATATAPLPAPGPGGDLDPAAALMRTRVRARVSGHGRLSAPGPASTSVVSGRPEAELVALGLSAIAASDFERRLAAHALLVELGDRARPALVQLEDEGSPGQSEAAALVLDAIEGRGSGGAPSARRLLSRALAAERPRFRTRDEAASWLGDVPAPLLAPDPMARAAGMLALVDRAEVGQGIEGRAVPGPVDEQCERALAWVRALAAVEPDEGVRALAGILLEVAGHPSSPAFDAQGPAWLLPSSGRGAPPITASMADLPERGEELLWTLESRPELGDLDLGLALARVTASLRRGAFGEASGEPLPSDALYDYDVHTTRLALELVERAASLPAQAASGAGAGLSPRGQLLAAVRALLPGPALDLAAWRQVTDRRGAAPSAAAFDAVLAGDPSAGRARVLLEAPTLDALREALEGAGGAQGGLDILLPPGHYEAPEASDRRLEFVDLRDLRRVRLRPARPEDGPVLVGAGVRLFNATDIVLEGIEIDGGTGQGLTLLDGSHAVLVGARVTSSTKAVYMADSTLEVRRSVLTADEDGRENGRILAQLIGHSRLFARASTLLGGSLYIGQGTGSAWLDRCVLESGRRPLVQGQRGATLFMRESLARSQGVGLMTVEDGLVVASVIDAAQNPLGRGAATGLRVSPRLLRLVQPGQAVPAGMALDEEPLRAR